MVKSLKEQLLNDTPYLPVYKFLLDLGIIESVLLSKLIDVDSYASCRLIEDRDYFECTDSFIKKEIGLTSPTIKKYLDFFVNNGYIFVRKIKKNGTDHRFVKLNNDKLLKKYFEYKQNYFNCSDSDDEYTYISKNKL